ncbi:hypothetical protein [Streptomyces sp. NBC_01439]|uniref:hypothetical protein n=1 Tax=Streptomyces sp. NBC_01439 TaxID=2903867 RepID=UPI002E2A5354|nr:hypothetical protein [Streptomyces sp. NBC_01439]
MGLTAEISAYRAGLGDPRRLVGEFRRAALLVPRADAGADAKAAGGVMSAVSGGIRWLYVFTDEEALFRFAQARGEGDRERPYLTMLGARLLDAVVPMSNRPAYPNATVTASTSTATRTACRWVWSTRQATT